jgi:hypothetical protein
MLLRRDGSPVGGSAAAGHDDGDHDDGDEGDTANHASDDDVVGGGLVGLGLLGGSGTSLGGGQLLLVVDDGSGKRGSLLVGVALLGSHGSQVLGGRLGECLLALLCLLLRGSHLVGKVQVALDLVSGGLGIGSGLGQRLGIGSVGGGLGGLVKVLLGNTAAADAARAAPGAEVDVLVVLGRVAAPVVGGEGAGAVAVARSVVAAASARVACARPQSNNHQPTNKQ